MPRMTGNRFIAEMLRDYGVTHVFQVPTAFFGVMREMEDMDIRRVVTHGEKAAAYMADGYARASKRVGICMAQNIGTANLGAGLADAYMGHSPVIAMTGALPAEHRYRHAYQEYDHEPWYESVTKSSVFIDKVSRLPDALRQAFRDATSGSPGPSALGYTRRGLLRRGRLGSDRGGAAHHISLPSGPNPRATGCGKPLAPSPKPSDQ